MVPPHPGLGPQRLEQRGKGRPRRRLKAICIACGGMRLASSHGMAVSQAPARGPAWERRRARELGGKEGRSTRSRECTVRVRDAWCCQPCGQSPAPGATGGAGRPTSRSMRHVGQSLQPWSCNMRCMRRFSEAVHALSGLRREELQVVDRAPRQARVYGRQRVCPRGPVRGRRRGLGGLQSKTAQRPRQGGNVPCRGSVCVTRSSEHVLQRRGMVRMAWLARGEAQRSESSHADWRSGSLGSWSRSSCSARSLSSAHAWTKAGCPTSLVGRQACRLLDVRSAARRRRLAVVRCTGWEGWC